MNDEQKFQLGNLGLFRLENFVGRKAQLETLKKWLDTYHVIAITGDSGVGKSSLATALAVSEANRFEEGILWIGAMGADVFDFYDIVRDVEDVLATGITNQPVKSWGLLALQQLYGYQRLLIIDEMSNPDADTLREIVDIIEHIGPGGTGSFVLVGRTLPQVLLDLVGEAHLHLGDFSLEDVAKWVEKFAETYQLSADDAPLLHQLTQGHPLALKLVADIWHTEWLSRLQSALRPIPAEQNTAQLDAIIHTALSALARRTPIAVELLTRCSQASGGISAQAMHQLYWQPLQHSQSLVEVVEAIIKSGLMLYNPIKSRYLLHPMIRHHLNANQYAQLSKSLLSQFNESFTQFYLSKAQDFITLPPEQWRLIDDDWGNIRNAFNLLVHRLEQALNTDDVASLLSKLSSGQLPTLPIGINDTLILIRDYALTLRNYLSWRHPPEAMAWLAASVIAARYLSDRHAQAHLSLTLAGQAYFHANFQRAHQWFRQALPYFKERKDYPRAIDVTLNLGLVLRAMDNFDEALEVYEEALDIAIRHQLQAHQARAATLIGSINYHRERYSEALKWYRYALGLYDKTDDLLWQAALHNNIGLAIEGEGDFEAAIAAYRRAESLYEKTAHDYELSVTCGNLGAAYYALGDVEQSLVCYARDQRLQEKLGRWLDLAAILHNMGHVALLLDNLDEADAKFTRSRDLYLKFGQNELAEEEQTMLDTIHNRRALLG